MQRLHSLLQVLPGETKRLRRLREEHLPSDAAANASANPEAHTSTSDACTPDTSPHSCAKSMRPEQDMQRLHSLLQTLLHQKRLRQLREDFLSHANSHADSGATDSCTADACAHTCTDAKAGPVWSCGDVRCAWHG
jgi:hypothetical protein